MPPIDPAAVDAAIACPQCGGELTVFQSGPDSRLPRHLQECRDCDLPYPLWEKWKALADACEHYRQQLAAVTELARLGQPDDGELVTEEWLRSVATEMYDENTFVFMIASGVDRGEDGDEPWFQAAFVQLGCWWLSDGYQDSFTVEWSKPTRGHVRRLCQALGIALPAAPEGGD